MVGVRVFPFASVLFFLCVPRDGVRPVVRTRGDGEELGWVRLRRTTGLRSSGRENSSRSTRTEGCFRDFLSGLILQRQEKCG